MNSFSLIKYEGGGWLWKGGTASSVLCPPPHVLPALLPHIKLVVYQWCEHDNSESCFHSPYQIWAIVTWNFVHKLNCWLLLMFSRMLLCIFTYLFSSMFTHIFIIYTHIFILVFRYRHAYIKVGIISENWVNLQWCHSQLRLIFGWFSE